MAITNPGPDWRPPEFHVYVVVEGQQHKVGAARTDTGAHEVIRSDAAAMGVSDSVHRMIGLESKSPRRYRVFRATGWEEI